MILWGLAKGEKVREASKAVRLESMLKDEAAMEKQEARDFRQKLGRRRVTWQRGCWGKQCLEEGCSLGSGKWFWTGRQKPDPERSCGPCLVYTLSFWLGIMWHTCSHCLSPHMSDIKSHCTDHTADNPHFRQPWPALGIGTWNRTICGPYSRGWEASRVFNRWLVRWALCITKLTQDSSENWSRNGLQT